MWFDVVWCGEVSCGVVCIVIHRTAIHNQINDSDSDMVCCISMTSMRR